MRRFLKKAVILVLPIWTLFVILSLYISFFVLPHVKGDLFKIGMIDSGEGYDVIEPATENKSVYYVENSRLGGAKILAIGDSFFQQGKNGIQKYLIQRGVEVKNLKPSNINYNPILYAYYMLKNRANEMSNYNIILIESAERLLMNRIVETCYEMDEDTSDDSVLKYSFEIVGFDKIEKPHQKETDNSPLMNARNFLLFKIGFGMSPVLTCELQGDLFSSSEPNKLYFYRDDISNGVSLSDSEKAQVVRVFNAIESECKNIGVSFLFIVAVDKYDLYQDFIKDNPYPKKSVNEDLRAVISDNRLVLTKNVLYPYIEKNKKDIFYFNDSHWTYKASRIVANDLYEKSKVLFN